MQNFGILFRKYIPNVHAIPDIADAEMKNRRLILK